MRLTFNSGFYSSSAIMIAYNSGDHMKHRRSRLDLRVGRISRRRTWQPTPVFLPGISYGQRSLAGYSLWGRTELDMTNTFTFHFTELLNSVLVIIKNVTLWILSSSQ